MAFGAPDWLATRWPIRSTVGSNQAVFKITVARTLTTGTSDTYDKTVASGKRMIVSLVEAISPVSVIQEVDISIDDVVYWRRFFDVHAEIYFPDNAALILNAGEKLTITLQNNDTATQTLRANIAGLEEDV